MPLPVITVGQMREWERATWDAGRTEEEVISRVGHIVTQRVRKLTRPGDLVLVLAGKGHNGDDARHTSQHLSDRELALINVTDPKQALIEFEQEFTVPPALIVDGLFGIGINRRLDEDWIRLIERVNACHVSILAIDTPSGLNADTGEPQGAAIKASCTLTLGAPKRGLLSPAAYPYVGRLEVAPDIGLVSCPLKSDLDWLIDDDFAGYPPPRNVDSHKGGYGHLGVLSGSVGYHGAAVLAAKGALRARPGLITLCTCAGSYAPVASQLRMPMVHPWDSNFDFPKGTTAILAGPGLAAKDVPEKMKERARELWREFDGAVVVDASALDWLETGRISVNKPRVITPHPGEAGRMLGSSAADVQKDRLRSAQELSKRFGDCWVVLKGHQTIVANGSGRASINSSGNPCLAQGGSGDALGGFIAGLLAQPRLADDPERALCYAVWQHGAVADVLSEKRNNWLIEDLLDRLGDVP